jgi:hypothetical protein
MITVKKLNDAIKEAVRFIKIAEKAKERLLSGEVQLCKETGAARRASMDLTRQLSALRDSSN